MLIYWLLAVVYLAILLSWLPESWSIALPQIGTFLIAGTLLIRQIRSRTPFRFSPDTIALILLVIWGPIQVLTGLSVNPYATWNTALYWLSLAAIYFTARFLLTSRAERSRFLTFQVWFGTALAIISVLLSIMSPTRVFGLFTAHYTAYGPFIYKNHLAVFIELILPIAFYKTISSSRRKLSYAVFVAALLASMVGSLSRGGVLIVALELVALAAIAIARGQLRVRALLQVSLPMAALVIIFALVTGWSGIVNRFREQNPFAMRAHLADSTIHMIERRPLTGFGLGTWRTAYPEFATFDIARLANEAHDDWLQWAADGGIFFALVVLFFAVWVSRFCWRHLWGIGVPAIFLHGFLDYPTHNFGLAALLFLFAGALAATAQREESVKPEAEWSVLSVRTASE